MATFDITINISVSIPIIGDESIMLVTPPENFIIRKIYLKDYFFRENITDGRGRIITEYINAVHHHDDEDYLICLESNFDSVVHHNKPANSIGFMNGSDFDDMITLIHEQIEATVFKFFSLLHLYKEGEVTRKNSFYKYRTTQGICSTERIKEVTIEDAITIIRYPMTIAVEELSDISDMLYNHSNSYLMLKNVVIDDLEYTYHTLDDSTNYKNLMTPLEVMFLKNDYGDKKEMLSKRIAVFLGGSDANMKTIYDYVKCSYRDRSDAIHEGITQNITRSALDELRNLIRRVSKKYMYVIEQEITNEPNKTFEEIKDSLIADLKNIVVTKNRLGIW